MAKLADALDLGSSGATLGSSSLPIRTHYLIRKKDNPLKHTIKELEHWGRELVITVERPEIQGKLNEAYLEAQPHIELKGFRKGKAPLNLIKKLYGKSIEKDSLQEIAQEQFNVVFKEQKLSFLGEPIITNISDAENGYSFTFFYEVMPDFEMKDYRAITIDEPIHNVSEEEVQFEIDEICNNFGEMEVTDQVLNDLALVNITIRKIDETSGMTDLGKAPETSDVYLHSPQLAPDLKREFMNLKTGDSFNFRIPSQDPDAPKDLVSIQLNEIKKIIPSEFNDELAAKATGERLTTAQDLRDEIGFQLQEQWNKKSRDAMEEQIIHNLVEMHDFEVPKILLENTKRSMAENFLKQYKDNPTFAKIKPTSLANEFEAMAIPTLRWELIKTRIIENEDIKIEDYDMDPIAEAEAIRRKSDVGRIKEELMGNENVLRNILDKKVMDLILDFAITTEVPFDEHGHYHLPGDGHHHHHDDDEEEGFSFDNLDVIDDADEHEGHEHSHDEEPEFSDFEIEKEEDKE